MHHVVTKMNSNIPEFLKKKIETVYVIYVLN